MPECSLCRSSLDFEGGFILFTDHRGKSFEVCGECVGYVVLFHNPSCEEDKNRALDYITGYKETVDSQIVFGELIKFLYEGTPKKADTEYKPENLQTAVAKLRIQGDFLKEEAEDYNELIQLRRTRGYGGWIPFWPKMGSVFQCILILIIMIIVFLLRFHFFRR